MTPASADPPTRPEMARLYAGIFLTAAAVLLLQITLTRLFAVLMWHHFAYMIVSLALLGFGASGSLLTVWRVGRRRAAAWNWLALFATAFGATVILCSWGVTKIRVDSIELLDRPANLLALALTYVALSVPFLFCGLTIGSSIAWYPERVGKIYGVDLLGAAAGAALAPWLLGRLQIDAAIMVGASVALAAGALFAWNAGGRRRLLHALPLAGGLVLTFAVAGGGLGIPELRWPVPFAPHKMFANLYFPEGRSETSLPSATAQVDVSRPARGPMRMAADFGASERQAVVQRGVTQDGTAPTVLYRDAAEVGSFTSLDNSQGAAALLAYRAAGREAPKVLVIGVGGGVDVMMALFFESPKVTAVEINQAMIDMVTRDYADFIGHLFDDPRVRLVKEEGRAFLKRSRERYDVIQLNGTDTFAALTSGAYTLHESYMYTEEAVMDMYARLEEGGSIQYSRAILTTEAKPPRETLRLANVARSALERLGVAEPWRHVAVFQGVRWASTIVRKGPFTAAEVDELTRFAVRENFFGLVFDPLRPTGTPMDNGVGYYVNAVVGRMLPEGVEPQGDALALLGRSLGSGVRGYLAHSDAEIAQAAASLAESGGAPPDLVPTLKRRRDAILEAITPQIDYRREVLRDFQTVLRGGREERERFVSEYLFDLRPPTDDRPFFFDYFKAGRFFDYARETGDFNEILPEIPVGHAVLVASLAQILLLAALLILLPLRAVPKPPGARSLRTRSFVYFTALGLGFMFVEISLMQKFVLFLGHPTYSLSVVLGGLLLFSGLGALFSSRVPLSRRAVTALFGAIVVVLLLDRIGLDWLLAGAMGLERTPRVLVALLVLAPTSFALGCPFPLGVRLLERRAPALIPWGWAVNGFVSVAGSLVAIMLAMAVGFSALLFTAAAIYALALLAFPLGRADTAPPA